MQVGIDSHLFLLGLSITIAWFVVRFLLVPRTRRALATAGHHGLIGVGGRLGLLTTLQSILDAMLVAGLFVALFALALNGYLAGHADSTNDATIQRITAVRDGVEQTIDHLGQFSVPLWIGSLAVLGLIWLAASRSSSRRSWQAALTARRTAFHSEISDVRGDELLARAQGIDPAGVEALEERTQRLIDENDSRIRAKQTEPVAKFGENVVSLDDLRNIEQSARTQAANTADANISQEERDRLVQFADRLRGDIDGIEGQLGVALMTLKGTREVSLKVAKADPRAAMAAEERDSALRSLIVEMQLSTHNALSTSRSQREPELIREWVATGATSVATVRTTSALGRSARFVSLIIIFLSFVGLGVMGVGPAITAKAAAISLQLMGLTAAPDLAKAADQGAADAPQSDSQSQLASDEATVNYLRQSFRSAIARGFMDERAAYLTAQGRSEREVARERFEHATIEARQRVLQATARLAAPSLESGRPAQRFRFSEDFYPDTGGPGAVLDQAIDHRIEMFQQREGLWIALRTAAARPAPADLAGDAFLKTLFPNIDSGNFGIRLWAERASIDFALQTARNGRVPDKTYHAPPYQDGYDFLTARDRRLVADYQADAPQRMNRAVAAVHDGAIDPGSLHRDVPAALGRLVQSPYDDTFPPSSGGGGGFGPNPPEPDGLHPFTPPPNLGPGPNRPARPTRVASAIPSRSYARVRFSGRIGGVVIGIDPQPGGDELDIRRFEWQLTSNIVQLTLADGAGWQVKLGPYHAAIVHQALAYAADGRVVTATMPQPQASNDDEIKLDARRVVVHPALEDTAFACRAIEVDRFVDAFTIPDDKSSDALSERITDVRGAVDRLGTLLQVTAATPAWKRSEISDSRSFGRFVQPIARLAQTCGTDARCFPVDQYKTYGFRFGGASGFLACLAEKKEAGACFNSLDESRIETSWLVDSGVREAPFHLDRKFAFLTGENETADRLWPLDFMIQAVPQTFAEGDVRVGENWEPWRFPTIDSAIKEAVARGVDQNPDARAVLANIRDFTILQRLFRVAFKGDLGFEFPLDELVKLQSVTAPFVKTEWSLRWNPTQPLIETLKHEHTGLIAMLEMIVSDPTAGETCKAVARASLQAAKDAPWPEKGEGLWSSVGGVENSCTGTAAASPLANRLALLRRYDLVDEAIHIDQMRRSPPVPFKCSPL